MRKPHKQFYALTYFMPKKHNARYYGRHTFILQRKHGIDYIKYCMLSLKNSDTLKNTESAL